MAIKNRMREPGEALYNVRCEWMDWIDGGASIRLGERYVGRDLPLGDARSLASKLIREYRKSESFGEVPGPYHGRSQRNLVYKVVMARPHLPRGVELED